MQPFGKYLLLEQIHVGGMAEVHLAKLFDAPTSGRLVAVKRIISPLAGDATFIRMLLDEAEIAGQLVHPNICAVLELGCFEQTHFIAMEYVWGKDLLQLVQRLRERARLVPPAIAAYLLVQVCNGLDDAHRLRDAAGQPLNIVHRDVSPPNVLISYAGHVKLADFGIAHALSRLSQTPAGLLKGKVGYMSPEQAQGRRVDRRSDVFAVGTLLYQLTTGQSPFPGETDLAVLDRVREGRCPPPGEVSRDVPDALGRITVKAMQRDPEKRYQSAAALREDLERFLAHEGFSMPIDAQAVAKLLAGVFEREKRKEREALARYNRVTFAALKDLRSGAVAKVASPQGASRSASELSAASRAVPSLRRSEERGLRDPSGVFTRPGEDVPQAKKPTKQARLVPKVKPAEPARIASYPERPAPPKDMRPARVPSARAVPERLPVQGPPASSAGTDDDDEETPTRVIADPGRFAEEHFFSDAPPTVPVAAPPAADGPLTINSETDTITTEPAAGQAPVADPEPVAPREKTSATLARDLLIGVFAGIVFLLAVVVLGYLISGGTAPRLASLVVVVDPPQSAHLLINGKPEGEIKAGIPLGISEIAAREHRVTLVLANGERVERSVPLRPGEVGQVQFDLSAARPAMP